MRRVLLVEDNSGDVAFTRRAFQGYPVKFEVAKDGEAALVRLFSTSQPVIDLVLLDLNLPRVSGWDVLEQVKSSPITRSIPIIVLSSSESEVDIARAYARHANAYLVKPATPDRFRKLASGFDAWWFSDSIRLADLREVGGEPPPATPTGA